MKTVCAPQVPLAAVRQRYWITVVAALGLIEAVAAAQTLARRTGDRLNSSQEFFGQGFANLASGLLSGYPCSGSFTRSALAQQAGAG